jgi:hypothetical protein
MKLIVLQHLFTHQDTPYFQISVWRDFDDKSPIITIEYDLFDANKVTYKAIYRVDPLYSSTLQNAIVSQYGKLRAVNNAVAAIAATSFTDQEVIFHEKFEHYTTCLTTKEFVCARLIGITAFESEVET